MTLLTVIVIAVGLAMDAFAVAIVEGGTYKKLNLLHAFRVATLFGLFQAVMPVVGYFCGLGLRTFIAGYDHWIAFGLLSTICIKMIYESFKIKGDEDKRSSSEVVVLLVLSIATSIDALAVGITLGFVETSIAIAAVIIGVVTFVLSYLGVYIGQKFGHFFESRIEAVGGLILVAIGLKILFRHILG